MKDKVELLKRGPQRALGWQGDPLPLLSLAFKRTNRHSLLIPSNDGPEAESEGPGPGTLSKSPEGGLQPEPH